MTESSVHPISSLDSVTNGKLMDDFLGEKTGFVQAGAGKYLLPAKYAEDARGFYDFQVRNDDVWIVTFPRSGTTLSQELVWMVMNNFDYKTSAEVPLNRRVPFYEYSVLYHETLTDDLVTLNKDHPDLESLLDSWRTPGYVWGEKMSSPRIFKTHLPLSLLPPRLESKGKCIYVARSPKDVLVSYYHHNKLLKVHGYTGDLEKYWSYFKQNLVVYSPYWEHVKEGWARRRQKNFLFLLYEDLIKDLSGEIMRVARFLDRDPTPAQVDELASHLQIDNFRTRVIIHSKFDIKGRTTNHDQGFVRKGKIGSNEELSPAIEKEIQEWSRENLTDTDLAPLWS